MDYVKQIADILSKNPTGYLTAEEFDRVSKYAEKLIVKRSRPIYLATFSQWIRLSDAGFCDVTARELEQAKSRCGFIKTGSIVCLGEVDMFLDMRFEREVE